MPTLLPGRSSRGSICGFQRKLASGGFTLVELLVVITIIGILIALLLPAVQAARESARRTQCASNLKQIALGLLQHESQKGYLPSAGWGDWWTGEPGRGTGYSQPGSWFYSVLPYVEQPNLANIGVGLSNGGENSGPTTSSPLAQALQQLITTPVALYICPSRRPLQLFTYDPNFTGAQLNVAAPSGGLIVRGDYAGNCGDTNRLDSTYYSSNPYHPMTYAQGDSPSWWQGLFAAEPSPPPQGTGACVVYCQLSLASITDGLSNTYLVGEKYVNPDAYFNGSDGGDNENVYTGFDNDNDRSACYPSAPTGTSTANYLPPTQDQSGVGGGGSNVYCSSFGSAHSGSLNMTFCDGSVHAISYSINPETHRRLANRADGLPVDATQYSQ